MKTTSNNTNRAGFTLAEIMVVIGIIALLLLIALPSIATIRTQMMVNQSKSIINLIGDACNQYRNDHNVFPDSTQGIQGGQSMQGRHRLVEALVGYLDENGDGYDGPGWRIAGGRVWGPYNDADEFNMVKDGGKPVFIDAFNNYVYYWRFQNGSYSNNDNTGYFSDSTTIDQYTKKPDKDEYYRDDFILATKGPNGKAERVTSSDSTSDDITNFLEE